MLRYFFILFTALSGAGLYAQNGTHNYVRETVYKNGLNPGSPIFNTPENFVTTTYYDGLGRPIQQIQQNQSPDDNKNIVTHIEYEKNIGQIKEYLPFTSAGKTVTQNQIGGGTLITYHSNYVEEAKNQTQNFYNTDKYEYTPNPYTENRLEVSPRQRIVETGFPGRDWSLEDYGGAISADQRNTLRMQYDLNRPDEVRRYRVTTTFSEGIYKNSISEDGYYPAASLTKTIVRNENWKAQDGRNNTSEEFKDPRGFVVLKRTYNEDQPHDTYYIYNQSDLLAAVLPPLAKGSVDAETLNQLGYQYHYDAKKRIAEKKLPQKDWEYMVYDKQDRLILFQDGNLRTNNNNFRKKGWMFTKYDAQGRVVYTGFFINTATRMAMQNAVNSMLNNWYNNEERSSTPFTQNGIDIYYTKKAFPTGSMVILTVDYYDRYPAHTPNVGSQILGQTVLTDQPAGGLNTKGLALVSHIRAIETEEWTKKYNWYDVKKRVIATNSEQASGTSTRTLSKLSFSGLPLQTVTTHQRMGNSTPVEITDNYTYDLKDRLTKHTQKINAQQEELITANAYDELGVLIRKKTGGLAASGNGLQTTDYQYNIRGWLTQINDPGMFSETTDNDLFSFKINYNRKDDEKGNTGKALYNGNINSVLWKTATDNISKGYSYDYDGLNRLTNAQMMYFQTGWTMGFMRHQAHRESMNYDLNGNIRTLNRTGAMVDGQVLDMDELDYTYNGNQLTMVRDYTNNPDGFKEIPSEAAAYTYDGSGNLITDTNKRITKITYNHLNLPIVIDTDQGSIYYVYDAAGNKLKKSVLGNSGPNQITEYIDGFQYLNGTLQFFAQPEGYTAYQNNAYLYHYIHKDHLGNNRVVYADGNNNGVIEPTEILEENNYYPFGLKHQGYNDMTGNTASNYKYQYNGKELQDEMGLNLYDFGARNYDPALGRWMNIDPLAENSRRWTPYNYAYNNPIFFIDPDGMQSWSFSGQAAVNFAKDLQILLASDGIDTDYTFNRKTGEIKQHGEKNNNPDRIIEVNKRGEAIVKVDNIAQGILQDGMNLKTKSEIIKVNGYNLPTTEEVEDFAIKLQEYVGREVGGLYISENADSNLISHITIGKYEKNNYTKTSNYGHSAMFSIGLGKNNIRGFFHTHPQGRIPSRADLNARDNGLSINPKLYFNIITTNKHGESGKIHKTNYTNYGR